MFELGNNLREARQRRRIDLVAAEQDTKIRSKYLAALETEDFDVLPGPVFVRGFLRTYSRYLGLDPQLFVDEYNARFGRFEEMDDHDSPVLGRPGLAHDRERKGRRAMRTVAIVTVVVVALLAWLGLRSDTGTSVDDLPTRTPQGAGSAVQPGGEPDALSEAAATARTQPAPRSRAGAAGAASEDDAAQDAPRR